LTEIVGNRIKDSKEGRNQRQDILQSLIDAKDAEVEEGHLTPEAIMGETCLFLIAGSETTSNTVGFAIINLLHHPEKLARLQAEIDELELEKGKIVFDHDQLKHLPYLNAVINETLRLDTVGAGALSRITEGPTKLGNLDLEKGVSFEIYVRQFFFYFNINSSPIKS
jgi:cytochrome P450